MLRKTKEKHYDSWKKTFPQRKNTDASNWAGGNGDSTPVSEILPEI